MKIRVLPFLALISLLALFASRAFAAGALSVTETQVLKADPATVWAAVGDFATLNSWHPAVVGEEVQGSGDMAGDVRVLTLGDGGKITERLVSRDPQAMKYTYDIVESPLPVQNYESTIKVVPDGEHGSMFVWSSTFDAKEGVAKEEAINAITGVYKAGTAALAKKFP